MADWFSAHAPGAEKAPNAAAHQDWFAQHAPKPETEQAPAEERSVAGFLGNALSSGANFVGNAVQGASLLGRAVQAPLTGGVSLMADPELMAIGESLPGSGPRLMRDAASYFGNRYGSLEALGNTAYEDPVGMAADASTVLSAGGTLAARAPGMVGRAGRAMAAAGTAADPTAVAARTAGAVARPMARGGNAVAGMLDNVPASSAPVSARDLALGSMGGMLSGDPMTALATTAGSAALRSPAVRHGMASGLRGGGRVLTRTADATDANSDMLTRLALLAAMRGDS